MRRIKIEGTMAGDFIVIVAGVLVALIAETWWSEREDRQFERDIVADMALEFEANVSILEVDIAKNSVIVGRMADLVAMPFEKLAALSDDELETLLFAPESLAIINVFDPAIGITQALVRSGELPRIKDRSMRLHMASWSGLLQEGERNSLQCVQGIFELRAAIAKSRSDGHWSAAERLELQYVMEFPHLLADLVLQNQSQLHSEADKIREQLELLRE